MPVSETRTHCGLVWRKTEKNGHANRAVLMIQRIYIADDLFVSLILLNPYSPIATKWMHTRAPWQMPSDHAK